jgi:hypothetical protein
MAGVVEIEVTEKMIKISEDIEKDIIKNLKPTPNYTGFAPERRFYYGALGELVFLKYCIKNKIWCSYEPETKGESGGGDFNMFNNVNIKMVIDVKTASQPFHKKMMIPKLQFELYSYDYYVAIKINSSTLSTICGYCKKEDFILKEDGFIDSKIPTYFVELNELKSIDDLTKDFRKGEPVYKIPFFNC